MKSQTKLWVLLVLCASLSRCAEEQLQSLKSAVESALNDGLKKPSLDTSTQATTSPSPSPPSPPPLLPGESPWAVLKERPNLSIMRRAVDLIPGLSDALRGRHVMATFFFPTDEAFKEIFEAGNLTEDEFMSDPLSVRSIVLYHVSDSQAYYHEYLVPGEKITMYNGHEVVLQKEEQKGLEGLIVVDEMGREARIIEVEVKAGKGAVHIIDRCLVPAFASITEILAHNPLGLFSITKRAILQSSDPSRYSDPSNQIVLLAPTDEAWKDLAISRNSTVADLLKDKDLLDGVLSHHTLKGIMTVESMDKLDKGGEGEVKRSYSSDDTLIKVHRDREGVAVVSHGGRVALFVQEEPMYGLGNWTLFGVKSILLN